MPASRILLIALLLLAACDGASGAGSPTPAAPSSVSTATSAPTSAPTTAPTTAAPPTPSATLQEQAATATPEPPTPTPTEAPAGGSGNIVHLEPGLTITVTSIDMFDATTGWAIGGTGSLGDHVLRTADGGETWDDVTPPEPAALTDEVGFAIAAHGYFPGPDEAWVIYGLVDISQPAGPRVWHTADGGLTWTGSEPLDARNMGVTDFFAPSDLHFVDAQNGWFMAHLGVGMNHDYFAIYHTGDGGQTWAPVLGPQATTSPQSCGKTGLVFVEAAHGWLTGDCQGVAPGLFLYRSADGGATWTAATLPAPASAADMFTRDDAGCGTNSLTFFDAQTAKLAVACLILSTEPIEALAFVYTTTDGGATWTSAPAPARGLTFLTPQVGWSLPLTLGFDTPPFDLAQTTDGGATWTTVAAVDWFGEPDFVDEQTGWAAAYTADSRSLVRTTDGGATWETLAPVVAP